MEHEDDIALWERELVEARIPSLPTLEQRKYRRQFIAVIALSAGIITAAQILGTAASATNKPHIADPTTYRYSYSENPAIITIPTPDAEDGNDAIILQLTCDSNGSLTIDNTSGNFSETFTVKDIEEMKIAGVTSENPCSGGLSREDSQNLGSIAMKTGFASYNLPPQSANN